MSKTLIVDPIWGPKNFSWVLPLLILDNVPSYHPYAIPKKTNEPNLKKWQKKFGPNFHPLDPKLGLQIFIVGFTSTSS